jgi:hypothetical protein
MTSLTLTDDDCLNLRLALNATAIHWGERATDYRQQGDTEQAATCERIRSEYHRLWEAVNAAQEAHAAREAQMVWVDADAVSGAIEYLDLAHGDSNPDVNGVIARLAPRDAPCCQFHASGGDRALSCGGDRAFCDADNA